MRTDLYTKTILTFIAAMLAILALIPILIPVPAQAHGGSLDLYIEPGYTALRKPDGTAQLVGKVVINRRNTQPPFSQPMFLGKFEFSKVKQ
jgi:hypothetical protein